MMRFVLLILALNVFSNPNASAQKRSNVGRDTVHFTVSPGKHHVVNGVALSLMVPPSSDSLFHEINGVNIELGPFGIIAGVYGTMLGFVGIKDSSGKKSSFFSNYGYDSITKYEADHATRIRGLSISIGGLNDDTYNHGLFINGIASYSSEIKGVQITGLINRTSELNGLSVAALANQATTVKGVQIGLVNKCKTGRVLQVGLFNRIGKRVIPFVNFSFKKK